ncbi:MAG TPA: cereblon family protein [Polyangiaceae bacterium]|jgi:hypothetical protein
MVGIEETPVLARVNMSVQSSLSPGILCREQGESPKRGLSPTQSHELDSAYRARLRCRTCGTVIANSSALFNPGAEHPLVFSNPHGVVSEITTLRSALNLLMVTAPTTDATWFSGYGWQVALCAGCGTHLGWRFSAASPGLSPAFFFGLLTKELVEEADPRPS